MLKKDLERETINIEMKKMNSRRCFSEEGYGKEKMDMAKRWMEQIKVDHIEEF